MLRKFERTASKRRINARTNRHPDMERAKFRQTKKRTPVFDEDDDTFLLVKIQIEAGLVCTRPR